MTVKKQLSDAIKQKKAVSFSFQGKPAFGSPHALGKGDGEERVLIYRGEDSHEKEVKPTGKWACLRLADLSDVMLTDEPFHEGHPGEHDKACLHDVELSVK